MPTRQRTRTPAKADQFGRYANGERTRARIIEAAIDLFAERGYRGTGINALAERVDMTGAGLLYWFGTKQRLLQEVVAERDRVDSVGLHETLVLADLQRAGEHTELNSRLTQLFLVLGSESFEADAPLHEFFVDFYARRRAHVKTVLANELAAGRVRADIDIEQLSITIPAVVLGIEMQWLTDRNAFDIRVLMRDYFAELAEQLAP